MKRVPLVNSEKTAQVDDEDWPLVARFRWYYWHEEGVAMTWINGELVEMGRLVLHPEVADHAHGVQ